MTHCMKLCPAPFEKIKSGKKCIELRLYDEKRRKISVGDKIVFTQTASGEKLTAQVIAIYKYDSFKELYSALPLDKCGYSSEELQNVSYADMYAYYTVEEEKKYGAVGIELKL